MPLPLDALREVQDSLSNNMWMLGLPELAPFRAFILDAAAQCESGAVERALREVRREAREERDEQQREGRDERPATDAREVEEIVRAKATAALPRRSPEQPRLSLGGTTLRPRSFSQAQLLAFGPTIHLVRAAVYPDLTRGLKLDAVELFVQIWMVDSQGRCMGGVLGCMREAHQSERELYASEPQRALQNPTLQDLDPTLTLTLRCMGGVAQWPTKHGVLHGTLGF